MSWVHNPRGPSGPGGERERRKGAQLSTGDAMEEDDGAKGRGDLVATRDDGAAEDLASRCG